MINQEKLSRCSLLRTSGIGSQTFKRILETFGSASAYFSASPTEIKNKLNFSADKIEYRKLSLKLAEDDINWLKADSNNHILTWEDEEYPKFLLDELKDAPPVLFVKGDPDYLQMPQLAIVGSRNASKEGLDFAFNFARTLAQQGLTISSGLALGIDGAAHRGAISSGTSIAVVGTGIDRVYPAQHLDLARQISASGAIVSEFPIGTKASKYNFPRRNRLISALSCGVLVIEASLESGSLITAKFALEQGKEVFAIPGSPNNPLAKGSNYLLKQGAKLVENVNDIWEELKPNLTNKINNLKDKINPIIEQKEINNFSQVIDFRELNDEESAFLALMEKDKIYSFDDLVNLSELESAYLSSLLMFLQLDGFISSPEETLFQKCI